ncbi:fam-a protein [Plasmodium chabaudi chabaudi]|uniref:Fam-a protein n=1 Tax=Plasmodium chabaudi chabaudi TaxID=31271 RepID=A0A077TSS6_PLACU|nr:fam-a protein [Plasmodium chabaudi chabaudi]SCL92763.1 fam-a protein [Plasmodium chabaudi chabaudi]VTZ67856.1 fam-a protein [Plasmodium chabaudi chabaudi]|eukprot:XP_016654395.1 fam-a protein [Plasmodium chabaudi chabaudi]
MNKLYIKVALALLCIAGYMQNVAFASETSADVATTDSPRQKNIHIENAIYQYPNGQKYLDGDEVLLSIEHVNQASILLQKLSATGVNDYSAYSTENKNCTIYSKKVGNMDIGRLHVTIPSASKYNDLLEKIWDFDGKHKSDSNIIRGIVSREYWNTLCLFEKQSVDPNYTPPIKKYALGSIFRKSSDTTVIVCPSRTINDDTEIDKETDMKEVYFNLKAIETDIDPEDALTKLGANISGFVIKKGNDDQVHVTYINAVYDVSNSTESIHNKRERGLTYANILSLVQRI